MKSGDIGVVYIFAGGVIAWVAFLAYHAHQNWIELEKERARQVIKRDSLYKDMVYISGKIAEMHKVMFGQKAGATQEDGGAE